MNDFLQGMQRYKEFSEAFRLESDRACAVLAMCVIEETLRAMFLALTVLGKDIGALFPQGNTQVSAENALALGLLTEAEARSYRALAKIRNEFAHKALENLTFDSVVVTSKLQHVPLAMSIPEGLLANQSPRDHYLIAASLLEMAMLLKMGSIARLSPLRVGV